MIETRNPGAPGCSHRFIEYLSIPLDGQAWWCDVCKRHERQPYTAENAGSKMSLPIGAYLRVPNGVSSNTLQYNYIVDRHGKAQGPISEPKVVAKADLEQMLCN